MRKQLEDLRSKVKLKSLGVTNEELKNMPMRDKFRVVCAAWAKDGLGAPLAVHFYYAPLKVGLYLFGIWLFQLRHSGRGVWRKLLSDKSFRKDAFQRLVIYNLLFEVVGLGCGSGPLAGRFLPPHTVLYHWLCPGTVKLPLRANARDSRYPLVPWLGSRRNRFDVLLFLGYIIALVRGLTLRRVTASSCRWICGFLGALAVVDHTIFLASRGEVYGYMALCHAAGAPVVGQQIVQLAIYFWAAVSKLGPWFNNVIQVMLSNSPVFPPMLKPHLYQDLEAHDFRPSALAKGLAQLGTAMEIAIPVLLPWGGSLSRLGMFFSVSMHTFIFTNFAAGAPQEWNVFTPLCAYHLFLDAHDGLNVSALRVLPSENPFLTVFLAFGAAGLQVLGSIYPPSNSFLTSMKYYAGNWPSSIWLIRKDAWHKLDKIHRFADFLPQQCELLFGAEAVEGQILRIYAFRAMHLPYKCIASLIELALQGKPFMDYQYMDGETAAGGILGFNFGDGYLHGRYMVQAVQDECCFEPGELLHIAIDSCPAHGNAVPWFVRDATALWDDKKALGIGQTSLDVLQEAQPY